MLYYSVLSWIPLEQVFKEDTLDEPLLVQTSLLLELVGFPY